MLEGGLKPASSFTYELFKTVMKWADKHRSLKIRTNADTPLMARQAVSFGAEGIGLCRTEHMFFDGDRIDYMRQMILAADEVQRRTALKKLLPFQRKDFVGLLGSCPKELERHIKNRELSLLASTKNIIKIIKKGGGVVVVFGPEQKKGFFNFILQHVSSFFENKKINYKFIHSGNTLTFQYKSVGENDYILLSSFIKKIVF